MKKIKIKNIIIAILILAIGVLLLIRYINYKNSYEYKLKEIGYSKEETSIILSELEKSEINQILEMKYSKNLTKVIKDKYFMFSKLNRYLNYYKENATLSARNVIEIVNVNRDKELYTDIVDSDVSKENLILVNKYYKLNENYAPKDLKDISLQYSYSGNKTTSAVYDHFVDMYTAAKNEKSYKLIISSSYRDYKSQKDLYDSRKKQNGVEETDKLVARPGHSEHQLGLSLDIDIYGKTYAKFEDTEEYGWLKDNSYKYGFILRYPSDKEKITGYGFESWHYRYVGLEAAEYIYRNNITFDEYYEYFLKNK